MARVTVALAVVVALAAGVWWFWPAGEVPMSGATTSTVATVATSTVGTVASTNTTLTVSTTARIEITVEEAEEILRELWFGWFEGIYDEDEARIREVVISEEQVDAAIDQFGVMELSTRPEEELILIQEVRILHSGQDCLVTWSRSDASALLGEAGQREGVDVFRFSQKWRLFSSWRHEGDLWARDCESPLS